MRLRSFAAVALGAFTFTAAAQAQENVGYPPYIVQQNKFDAQIPPEVE